MMLVVTLYIGYFNLPTSISSKLQSVQLYSCLMRIRDNNTTVYTQGHTFTKDLIQLVTCCFMCSLCMCCMSNPKLARYCFKYEKVLIHKVMHTFIWYYLCLIYMCFTVYLVFYCGSLCHLHNHNIILYQ